MASSPLLHLGSTPSFPMSVFLPSLKPVSLLAELPGALWRCLLANASCLIAVITPCGLKNFSGVFPTSWVRGSPQVKQGEDVGRSSSSSKRGGSLVKATDGGELGWEAESRASCHPGPQVQTDRTEKTRILHRLNFWPAAELEYRLHFRYSH